MTVFSYFLYKMKMSLHWLPFILNNICCTLSTDSKLAYWFFITLYNDACIIHTPWLLETDLAKTRQVLLNTSDIVTPLSASKRHRQLWKLLLILEVIGTKTILYADCHIWYYTQLYRMSQSNCAPCHTGIAITLWSYVLFEEKNIASNVCG